MHLFGFIIRIYHDARSSECQIDMNSAKSETWDLILIQNEIYNCNLVFMRTSALRMTT